MDNVGIFAREISALGRPVQIGVASGRVISVSFPETVPDEVQTSHPFLDRIEAALAEGDASFDDVAVALTVPTDQRRVLDAVRKVPPGETASLDQVLRLAGLDPDDTEDRRTVKSALVSNPVPVFIPDHRVDAPGATPDDVVAALRRVER
ncbi:MAG: MGMT family protein [Halobacteriota archaeon]